MADITKLGRLIAGANRNVDLTTNALVVGSLKIGAQELTELILGNLIALQDGSDFADGSGAHTHDGRYRTEAELSSNANGEGASMIGIEDSAALFTATTVEGALAEAIQAAQGANEANEISYDNTASGLTATDVQGAIDEVEGRLDTAESNISSNTSNIALKANDADVLKKDGSVALEGNMSMGGNKLTNVPTPTASTDAANKQYVDDSAAGIDSKEAVRIATTGNITLSGIQTIDGVVGADGDRVLVKDQTDATENGIYDMASGAWARSTDFDGTPASEVQGGALTFVTEGSANINTSFRLTGTGNKNLGSDPLDWIVYSRAESTTASGGIQKVGLDFSIDTDGEGLDATGQLSLELDGATLSKSASGVKVADLGVDTAQIADDAVSKVKINADVAGLGLGQAAAGELDVQVDDVTTEISGGNVIVKDGGISDAKVASGSNLEEAVTFFGSTDISGAEAEQLTDGSIADSLHKHTSLDAIKVAGEAFGANVTKVVRLGISGETAGRVYATSQDASASDLFYMIGLVSPSASISAGSNIDIKTEGTLTLGSGDTNFNAADIGKPVFLTTTGDFSVTAPSGADVAVYRIGIVEDVDKIFIDKQFMYIDA
jgi:hypothetical protein